MTSDPRESQKKRHGHVQVASGAGAVNTVININPEQNMAVTYVKIKYNSNATAEFIITVYDEPDGTGSGQLNDVVEQFSIEPGDRIILTEEDIPFEDIEDDLVIEDDGNSDDVCDVSFGGRIVAG